MITPCLRNCEEPSVIVWLLLFPLVVQEWRMDRGWRGVQKVIQEQPWNHLIDLRQILNHTILIT